MRELHMIQRAAAAGAAWMTGLAVFAAVPQTAFAAEGGILILGDSISSGYGLNEGEFGYYDYLADCTGKPVTNLAVEGYSTSDLIALIDDSSNAAAISAAEIICISVGGNDLLQPTKELFEKKQQDGESMTDTFKRISKEGDAISLIGELTLTLAAPRTTAAENYSIIESKLRALNPNAEIVMQTIYNPFEVSPEYLEAHQYSDSNITNYNLLMNYVTNTEKTLNKAIKALETVRTADISEIFSGSTWLYLRTDEADVHPNPLGHALIGAAVLETLGNSSGTSPKFTPTLEDQILAAYRTIPSDDLALLQKYAQPSDRLFGDLDHDGTISILDARGTLEIYSTLLIGKSLENTLTVGAFSAADVSGDGEITISDPRFILTYYVENSITGNDVTWFDITGNPNAPDAA